MKSKRKKISIIIGIIAILIIGIVFFTMKSMATDNNYHIKIKNIRANSKMGYRIPRGNVTGNNRLLNVWNLVNLKGTEEEELPLYCLQAGLGFFNETNGDIEENVTYDKLYDMKLISDKANLNNEYGDSALIIAKTENADIYSRVLWLADNMYVPNEDTENNKIDLLKKAGVITDDSYLLELSLMEKEEILKQSEVITEQDIKDYDTLSDEEKAEYEEYINNLVCSELFISDDVLEVTQQLAFWYVIHSNEADAEKYANYHREVLDTLYYATTEEAEEGEYETLSMYKHIGIGLTDIYLGANYQSSAEKLYSYLISEAENINSTYFDKVSYDKLPYGEDIESEVPIKIKDSTEDVKVEISGDNYIVGPYEIERTMNGNFEIEAIITGNSYEILDSSKSEVENIKSVVGDEIGTYQFYLSISRTETISTIDIAFNIKSNNRIVKLLLGEDALSEQPVLLVENNPAEDKTNVKFELEGDFKFNLIKYVEGTDIALKGAGFKVSIKDEDGEELVPNPDNEYLTDEDGNILIENLQIRDEGINYKVVIKETTVPEGYEGLETPIQFNVVSKLHQSGKMYSLITGQTNQIENAKKVEVKDDEVLIETENRPEGPHKGVKEVYNQDSGYYGDETQEWVIQTLIPSEIDKYGKYIITDEIDERLVYEGIKKVSIVDGEELKENTDYKVNYDETTRTLKIAFIEGDFTAGKNLTPGNTVEIRFNTTFALDDDGNIKALNQSVPNQAKLTYGNNSGDEKELLTEIPEVHTGKAGVYKYNEATGVALEGAVFKIATSEENAKKEIFVKDAKGKDRTAISNEKGIAMFYGLEFGEDAMDDVKYKTIDEITGAEVYKYDWEKVETKYYIVETEAPEGFIKSDEIVEVIAKKDSGDVIEIKDLESVANTPITGKFSLNLIKYVEGTDITLEGAGFKVSIKDEAGEEVVPNPDYEYLTNEDGEFTIEELDIKSQNKKYTITIEETTVPEGYEGLEGKIIFNATSILKDGNYILETSEITTIKNAKKVEVKDDEILVEAENKPEGPHKGVKEVYNQDSGYYGDETQEWVIQALIPSEIDKYGKYIITDEIDERLVYEGIKKVSIVDGEELKENTDYKVNYDETTRTLKIAFIEGDFTAGKNLTPGNTVEIRFNTTFALDDDGSIKALNQSVPNQAKLTYGNNSGDEKNLLTEIPEVHTGKAGVYKYNEATGVALEGAVFKIATSEENAKKEIFVKDAEGKDRTAISNKKGIAMFYGLEFGEDAMDDVKYKTIDEITGAEVYKYDWEKVETKYYIVETEAPEGFIKSDEIVEVIAKKDSGDVIEIEDLESVANKPMTGGYEILINKVDENKNYLEEVEFSISGIDNNGDSLEENIVSQGKVTTTGTKDAQEIVSAKITKDTVELTDTYTITETKTKNGYYKLVKPITIEVEKTEINEGYVVSKFTANGTEVADEIILNAELEGTDKLAEIRLTRDNNTLEIVIENIMKEGSYKVLINKVDSKGEYLEGVEFTTEGIDNEENLLGENIVSPVTTTGTENAKEIISMEIIAENVMNTDKYTITETVTKNGYYKLANPLTLVIEKEETNEGYRVSKFIVNETEVTDEITLNVELQGTKQLAEVKITRDNNILEIEVQNIEKTGAYEILINKVDEEGEYLEGVEFTTEGKDSLEQSLTADINSPVTTKGTENYEKIVSREITDENLSLLDTYTITESNTKEGYYKLATPIIVQVEKEEADEGYRVSKFIVNGKEITDKNSFEVDLEKAKETATITVKREGNTLDLVVENIPVETSFDLALRKVITKLTDANGIEKDIVNIEGEDNEREIDVDTKDLYKVDGETLITTAEYKHRKDPVLVQTGDIVTYEIIIYNESKCAGRATKVVDALPDGLEFIEVVDGDYKATKTEKWILFEKMGEENLDGFDGKTLDSETITVACKVTQTPAKENKVLTNIAFIYEEYNADTETTITNQKDLDIDSEPYEFPNEVLTKNFEEYKGNESNSDDLTKSNYHYKGQQDDDDFEKLIVKKEVIFDLALRKFITEVEGMPINNRYPEVKPGTEGRDFDYEHTKKPVELVSGDTVIYTIRVYNEGENAGYASEVMDDLPEGIIFLPEHTTNIEYRWVMYKEAENGTYEYDKKKYARTENPEEADIAITDYLDKEISEADGRDSLIKAYDAEKGITETNPDYRDIKIAFKVTEPNTSDRIIDNTAEITRDEDEDGNEVKDKDSTPGNSNFDEDDIDKEYIKVKYFDLALLKWVSKVSVTQDGKTTVTDTGHTVETARDEDPVLTTIDSKKVDSVIVKFIYDIRVENQGEIEGYAKEVKDHIPEGLVFKADDNPDWKQIDENTITTDALKDTLLKPGETATVQVILTWVNGDKNLNLKMNKAEISEDYNEWGVPDIDSTPNNMDGEPYEDDEDDAPVLLTLKTGQMPIYFILGFGVLAVLAGGIYLIRKYVYRV